MSSKHVPVLLKESLEFLITNKSGTYFDGTVGFGGHAEGILKLLNNDAKLVAVDVDENAFNYSKKKFDKDIRVKLYNYNFQRIDTISKIESSELFDGVFVDLGVSSFQLDDPSAGFTYRREANLDLRMDKTRVLSASELINTFSEKEIANIIYKYGEEKNAKKIAAAICESRKLKKISTTTQLYEIISKITSQRFLLKTLSRVFQAFRIYVNNELSVLEDFIPKAVNLLKKGGRIVILTYHSLEDRIVKEMFRYEMLECICPNDYPICTCGKKSRLKLLTKKPVVPAYEEILINPRARSAKLRAAERI